VTNNAAPKRDTREPERLVSVVIPSYNAAKTITRAIRSALEQDYEPLEVIVADDCSTDSTQDVVRNIRDHRVNLVPSSANRGAAGARNRGIRRATGNYVAFLDADDLWHPSKISTQVRMIEDNPKTTLVTCDCVFFDGSGNPRGTFYQRRPPVAGANAWRVLLAYNFVQTSTVLVRKNDLEELGGFSEVLPTGEDQDLWIRLAARGEVEIVAKTLVHVFDQPGSLAKRYQRREGDLLMSIIGTQLREHGHLLTVEQIRSAWGQRLFDIAANSYHNGLYGYSAPLFWRSACLGFRPVKSLINVARAAILGMLNRDDAFNLRAWQEGLTRAAVPTCERRYMEGGQI